MRFAVASLSWLACLLLGMGASANPLVLEGEVPVGGPFFDVPFEVPPGTVELEVRHDDLASENILDWGLEGPDGFRGYGGGNTEPAIVGEHAASRSYLTGPLTPGTWRVTVGKAKIGKRPARYRIEVHLRTTPTLTPQPERRPYRPSPALRTEARWYAGDFHVHSRESGDARAPLEDIATYARGRGLDFVHLSDHNTTSTLDFLTQAQARHPTLLLVPGVEYTTYSGHANAIGATQYVSPRMEPGSGLQQVLASFERQGAFVSINHPTYDVGDNCIGCAWRLAVPRTGVGAVEIATGGWDKLGRFFSESAMAWWDAQLAQGAHLVPVGGSDDHRAGVELNDTQSPISEPTTLVYARELSVEGLLEGLRAGRTVVKLQGPDDPMVELTSTVEPTGDTVIAERSTLSARVTGGVGHQVRLVHNGVPGVATEVTSDPFVLELKDVLAPSRGENRYRAEVLVGGRPRTVTSHLWLALTPEARGTPYEPDLSFIEGHPCGCGSATGGSMAVLALTVLGLWTRRRQPGRQS